MIVWSRQTRTQAERMHTGHIVDGVTIMVMLPRARVFSFQP